MVRSAEGSVGLLRAALAAIALALAACSGTASAPSAPLHGAPLTVRLDGKLAIAGQFADVTASQGSYTGPFTFRSTDGRVLYVTAIPSPRPAARPAAPFPTHGEETFVSKNGAVRITALGGGSASISIAGSDGVAVRPAQLNVVLPEVGAPAFHPNVIRFKTPHSAPFRFTLTQKNYVGLAVLISDCPYVATISQASPPPAGANVNVRYYWVATPLDPGSCEAVFTGGFKSGKLVISVGS